MNRLDEIKARAAYTGTNLNEYEPSPFTIDTARDLLMLDVPALVAAVEAVLALHKPSLGLHRATTPTVEFCRECGLAYPCDTVTAIRTALGEGEQ